MASVDQGDANRDGFPSSLSLEPNGHISASCHCHPLSIRSGLAQAPSFWDARSSLLKRHWTICLTPGQWCAECPGVSVLGRSVGKADRQEKQASETSSSVWTGCLSLSLKNHVYFASHNNQTNAVHAACSTVETNRNTFPHPNPVAETKYTYITLLVIQHNYGNLPIYRWFNHIYYNYILLSKMICHSYIKLPDGIGLAVQNWADLGSGSGPGSGACGYSPGPKISQKASPANGQCGPGLRESRRFPFIPFFGAQWTH